MGHVKLYQLFIDNESFSNVYWVDVDGHVARRRAGHMARRLQLQASSPHFEVKPCLINRSVSEAVDFRHF